MVAQVILNGLEIAAGLLVVAALGCALCACILSSRISRDEECHRGAP